MASVDWWRLIDLTIDDILFWADSIKQAKYERADYSMPLPVPTSVYYAKERIANAAGIPYKQLASQHVLETRVFRSKSFEAKLYVMAAKLTPISVCISCGCDMQRIEDILDCGLANDSADIKKAKVS